MTHARIFFFLQFNTLFGTLILLMPDKTMSSGL
jgi:hypothetical protein